MKSIFATLLILASFSAQAATEKTYKCLDYKTGAFAGKFWDGTLPNERSSKIIFAYNEKADDGWILRVNEKGELYNVDPMVRHARPDFVGTLTTESFQIQLTIKGQKMLCE